MRQRSKWLLVLLALSIPLTGYACEPILPLAQLLSGCTLASPVMLTQSLVCLAAAVAIKCAAFAYFERRLSWQQAAGYLMLANVLSTIPGVVVAAVAGSAALGIGLGVPIVGFLGMMVGRRLSLLTGPERTPWISGSKAAWAFAGFFVVSVSLFAMAGSALGQGDIVKYWIIKFLFVALAASAGILISTVLEECVVARLSRESLGNVSFYTSVWRANYITLGFVLLVAALRMLPKRMDAPGFIVSWLHSLSTGLGLM